MTPSHLSGRDTALALLVVFFWGSNFVVVRWGLGTLPPLLMAAIRFALVLFPAVFFLKKPDVSWNSLALYGLSVGTGQFGLLYIAMNGFISPGLASVVMQMQVFLTIAVAAFRTGEKPHVHQLLGLLPAIAGLAVILTHNGEDITSVGVVLVLLGATCWATSNQTTREAARVAAARGAPLNPLAYVVWASLFAMPGLFIASLVLEGPARIVQAVSSSSWTIWPTLVWQSAANATPPVAEVSNTRRFSMLFLLLGNLWVRLNCDHQVWWKSSVGCPMPMIARLVTFLTSVGFVTS